MILKAFVFILSPLVFSSRFLSPGRGRFREYRTEKQQYRKMHSIGTNKINPVFCSGTTILEKTDKKQRHQDRAHCATLYFRGFNLGNGSRAQCWSVNIYCHRSDLKTLENQFKHLPDEDQRVDHCNVTLYTDTALKYGPARPQQSHLQGQQNVKAIMWPWYPHVFKIVHTIQLCWQSQTVYYLTHSQAQVMDF